MSGPNLNKLPKSDNRQIPSEGLLFPVKSHPVDFGIDSPGQCAVLLSSFTSRTLSIIWPENCDLYSLRIDSHRVRLGGSLFLAQDSLHLRLESRNFFSQNKNFTNPIFRKTKKILATREFTKIK